MAGKRFTRYYQDPEFRAAIDDEFARADAATEPGVWITYIIHDPSQRDSQHPEGRPVYVGQTKKFSTRVRKRLREAGTATSEPADNIAGLLYRIMRRGSVPRFRVADRAYTALDSLVSETNTAKRLINAAYALANKWDEQKTGGPPIDRYGVPRERLWSMTASDAIGSRVHLVVACKAKGVDQPLDLSGFPADTRLNIIKNDCRTRLRETGEAWTMRLWVE